MSKIKKQNVYEDENMWNGLLSEALEIAVKYHKNQTDKSGRPYILHPIRVSQSFKSSKEKIVALLHDIVENTLFTLRDIERIFGKEIKDAVDAITKRPREKIKKYLDRVASNKIAYQVKLKDIEDNLSLYRLLKLSLNNAVKLVKKYHFCYNYLKNRIE